MVQRTRFVIATAEAETTLMVTAGDRIRTNRALKAAGLLDEISVFEYRLRLAHTAAVRLGIAPEDFDEWADTVEAFEESDEPGEAEATPVS